MKRITKDPDVRMAELLDAAEELFNQRGYRETSVSDIVNKVGVAQGTFYYYFPSKEDILEAIVARFFAGIVGEVRESCLNQQLSAPQKILLIFEMTFQNIRGPDGLLFGYLFQEKYLIDIITKQGDQYMFPVYLEIFETGNQAGEINVLYPREAIDFFKAIQRCLFESLYLDDDGEVFEKKIRIAESLVEKILGLPEASFNMQKIFSNLS